jgi:hypothetical protein
MNALSDYQVLTRFLFFARVQPTCCRKAKPTAVTVWGRAVEQVGGVIHILLNCIHPFPGVSFLVPVSTGRVRAGDGTGKRGGAVQRAGQTVPRRQSTMQHAYDRKVFGAPAAIPMLCPCVCWLAASSPRTLRRLLAQIESLGTAVSYRVESLLSVSAARAHSDREPPLALSFRTRRAPSHRTARAVVRIRDVPWCAGGLRDMPRSAIPSAVVVCWGRGWGFTGGDAGAAVSHRQAAQVPTAQAMALLDSFIEPTDRPKVGRWPRPDTAGSRSAG